MSLIADYIITNFFFRGLDPENIVVVTEPLEVRGGILGGRQNQNHLYLTTMDKICWNIFLSLHFRYS